MTINRRHLLRAFAAAPLAGLGAAGLTGYVTPAQAAVSTTAVNSAMHRFRIGDAQVTALLDGHIPLGVDLITDYDAPQVQKALAGTMYRLEENALQIPVNGYLIELGGRYTLVDTGGAAEVFAPLGGLRGSLAQAGVAPEAIDTILITHMHPDHTGGLLDSSGAILFPNAELVISQVEWEFWHDDAILASVPEGSRGFFHMARSAVAPYKDRLRLISGEAEAVPGVSAVPLPGHTLGHTGFMLDGGREGLLIWGDLVHMTALQFANPDMTIAFDADPAQTAASRRQMMDRAAADNLLVTGMHLDFPGLGQVKRQGDAYRYQSAPWQFGL